jgi:hypothetical protein
MPNHNYISMIKGKTYALNLGDINHIKLKDDKPNQENQD